MSNKASSEKRNWNLDLKHSSGLMIKGMNIEVKDATGTIISTGATTEMVPIFSPSIPQEIQRSFAQYIAEHPQTQSGRWEMWIGEKVYILDFSN